MPTEVLTRRPNPHAIAAALGARTEVQWDKALQNNPGLVHEAARRGFPHATRALAREAAIHANPLTTPNMGPLLPAPLFTELSEKFFPKEEATPTTQKPRTPDEIAADWDQVVQTDFQFILKAAPRNSHAAAALARWESQQAAPVVETRIDNDNNAPLTTQEPAREGVILNIFPLPLIRKDPAPARNEPEREWTSTEKSQLLHAGLQGYALQRHIDGDETDVMTTMTNVLRKNSVHRQFVTYFSESYEPVESNSDITLQRSIESMRVIGMRQAQLGQLPEQVAIFTPTSIENPEGIETIKNILVTAKTAEDVGQALKKLSGRTK